MFNGCSSLATLPEGFFIPGRTVWMSYMFANCPSLTVLPSSFSFPPSPQYNENAFMISLAEGEPRIATYYSGSDPSVLEYDWKSQNRTLVEDPADRSSYKVDFKLQNATPSEDGTFAWVNRTTIVTNEKGIVANPGTPQLEGYSFTGWCSDEDCLEPFDFNTALEADTTLYGKWMVAGGRNAAFGEGQLPVVEGSGEAWWELTAEGELRINGDGNVLPFGWYYVDEADKSQDSHWGPYIDRVKKVMISKSLQAEDLTLWFANMKNLVDVSKAFIPANARTLENLFQHCLSLEEVGESFILPGDDGQLESTNGMFSDCRKLKTLPSDFTLPKTIVDARWTFGNCHVLQELPASFTLAACENLENLRYMFTRCFNLKSLPNGFAIPASVRDAAGMFKECTSLRSLPEGFTFSGENIIGKGEDVDKAVGIDSMFADCPNLTHLPESLTLSRLSDTVSEEELKTMFTNAASLSTYYAGDFANLLPSWVTEDPVSFWAENYNRALKSETETPANQHLVSFLLPNEDGAYGDAWMKALSNSDDLLVDPVAPAYSGCLFLGWYTDVACTVEFDFKQTVASQLATEPYVLYAKYQQTSGDLPTTDGLYNASWSLSSDGTLTIKTDAPGAEVLPLWDTPESGNGDDWPRTSYWSPFRDQVKRVVMKPGIKLGADPDAAADSVNAVPNMRYWFAGMPALEDVSEVYVPEGVVSIARLFQNSGSLTSIPDDFVLPNSLVEMSNAFHLTGLASLPSGFVIPENVKTMYTAFSKTQLKTLPDGFSLPASVKQAGWLFSSCELLESIPESFVLNDGLEDAQCMFQSCKSLRSLPSSFTIPGSVTNAQAMFYECMELRSLPEGFKFEDVSKIADVGQMFNACPKLVSLPSTLDLSGLSVEKGFNELLFGARGYTPDAPLTTFYAGGDASKLAPASVTNDPAAYWKANFSRELVTSEEGLPEGVSAVAFNLQAPGMSDFSTWQTLLTDASGMLADPGVPERFGYAFSGWCTNQECTASSKFDFTKSVADQGLTAPCVLYSKYKLITRVEVPVKATLPLSASGESQPVAVQMRSFTPVPLEVTAINSKESLVADEIFPEAATRENLRLKLMLGLPPDAANAYELGLTGAVTPSGFDMAAAQNAVSPGILDYSIGLVVPEEAKIGIRLYDFTTTIADLTYEVTARP